MRLSAGRELTRRVLVLQEELHTYFDEEAWKQMQKLVGDARAKREEAERALEEKRRREEEEAAKRCDQGAPVALTDGPVIDVLSV